ncbi:hypothetical protein HKD37_20G056742 [Glycine soja]
MDIDRGFSLLEMLRLKMYSLESSESLGWCCLDLNFHVTSRLARAFTLSVPLNFFVDLLRVKRELAANRGYVFGLSCALSELSQSSTLSSRFFLPIFASIFL